LNVDEVKSQRVAHQSLNQVPTLHLSGLSWPPPTLTSPRPTYQDRVRKRSELNIFLSSISERKFTYEDDILNAIAGFIEACKTLSTPIYFCWGIPFVIGTSATLKALTWTEGSKPYNIPTDQELDYDRRLAFPSWSWAGWKFNVTMPKFYNSPPLSLDNPQPGLDVASDSDAAHSWVSLDDSKFTMLPHAHFETMQGQKLPLTALATISDHSSISPVLSITSYATPTIIWTYDPPRGRNFYARIAGRNFKLEFNGPIESHLLARVVGRWNLKQLKRPEGVRQTAGLLLSQPRKQAWDRGDKYNLKPITLLILQDVGGGYWERVGLVRLEDYTYEPSFPAIMSSRGKRTHDHLRPEFDAWIKGLPFEFQEFRVR
jgi:hypothetical protein